MKDMPWKREKAESQILSSVRSINCARINQRESWLVRTPKIYRITESHNVRGWKGPLWVI